MKMDEVQQTKTAGKEQSDPVKNIDDGIYSGKGIVEQASKERKRLEAENERLEKNLAELREFEAKSMLAGTAGGRIEPREVTEAKIRKNQAMEFWKGTSIADAIEKQPL
jgi:hypothetical protein